MKILMFSDLHFGPGSVIFGHDSVATLKAALEHAKAKHRDADLCVFAGDLVANGATHEYQAFQKILQSFPVPCRFVMGNHDNRAAFRSVFTDCPTDGNGFVQHATDVAGFRCLFLDTLSEGNDYGELDSERLDWLALELESTSRQCLIFLHHPPIITGSPACDKIGLTNNFGIATLLRTYCDKVAHVFFGHCHFAVAGQVGGVPALGVGSVLYQNWPNLSDQKFVAAVDRPGVYGVIISTPDGIAAHVEEFNYAGRFVSGSSNKNRSGHGGN